jgi:hypothetical protein
VRALTVSVERPAEERLSLDFELRGDLEQLRFPEPREPVRADGLWRHSCFEVFVRAAGVGTYWEYNLSPSRAWAAYQFSGYREGMMPLMKGAPPFIECHLETDTLSLSAVLDLSWLLRSTAGDLSLGIAAVVEDRARVLSYWALKHPAEKPDFHHAGSFVFELE